MISLGLIADILIPILLYAPEFKGSIELNNEVVAEILWHTATIACRITRYCMSVHIILDARALVEGIDDDAGDALFAHACLRKRESHDGCPLCRSNLCPNVIVGQIHLIIIRARVLGLVREPAGAFLLVVNQVGRGTRHPVHLRHDGELAVVVDPWRRLVRLLEAAYLVGVVGVLPPVAHFSGLRNPEIHAPRHSDGGVGVARGNGKGRHSTDEWIDIVGWLLSTYRCC